MSDYFHERLKSGERVELYLQGDVMAKGEIKKVGLDYIEVKSARATEIVPLNKVVKFVYQSRRL